MLRQRSRVRVVAAVAVFVTLAALVSTPVAAATVPVSTAPAAMLPDTSAATAGSVVGAAALAAVPSVAQAPVHAAAAAAPPPPVTTPFLSDSYCSYNGTVLPGLLKGCISTLLGSYDPLDNCFWKELVPQPPAGDPLWQGQSSAPPAKLYTVTCETHNGPQVGNAAATLEYSAQPPLNYNQAALTTLQQLALSVFVSALALAPVPKVETAPAASGKPGVVGLPVWMWGDIPGALWNQKSINQTVVFTKVALSFQGEQVDWDMGDGNHVICKTPGTAYRSPTPPNVAYKTYNGTPGPSPDCGWTYKNAGSYWVSATATWFIAFQVGSTSGTFVVSRTTPAMNLNIGELQVVTE